MIKWMTNKNKLILYMFSAKKNNIKEKRIKSKTIVLIERDYDCVSEW